MYFKQFYLGCLAHASYLIGSGGEAAVVDPQRDVEQYISEAAARGLRIRHVIETHLHADFVSGHRELAQRTGAEIIFGARAGVTFPHRAVRDGEEIAMGSVTMRFLETPGHTPEGITILVSDTASPAAPQKALTGDTLFIGDVGRPDLVGAKGFSAAEMAGMLYDSLRDKLLTLPDQTEVYPAHGAGSLCGRNMSKETSSTIGQQRQFNYALRPMPRDEFINMMTTDLPEVPAYFPRDVELNRTGAAPLGEIAAPALLAPADVQRLRAEGQMILDTRAVADFGRGHIPGSLNIGLNGQFASWAGTLIPVGMPLILVSENEATAREATMRLARVGLESVTGWLGEGIYGWDRAGYDIAKIPQMPVDELHSRLAEGADPQLIDVRRPAEYNTGHAPGAVSAQLSDFPHLFSGFDPARPTAVICGSGYRSSAATSILAANGFREIYNVTGGTAAWISAGYPVEGEQSACLKS
ncbi:MAG: MBL fold metallo-hydrolase [Blastocatellia bacterium]